MPQLGISSGTASMSEASVAVGAPADMFRDANTALENSKSAASTSGKYPSNFCPERSPDEWLFGELPGDKLGGGELVMLEARVVVAGKDSTVSLSSSLGAQPKVSWATTGFGV